MLFSQPFKTFSIAVVTLSFFIVPLPATANDSVDKALVAKLSSAQQRLSRVEKSVATEKNRLITQLNKLEQEVEFLQQKTAAARRLSDEKTLSLSQLESRIQEWREQQQYQQNVLGRFLHQQKLSDQPASLPIAQKLILLQNFTKDLQTKLMPSWHNNTVIMGNGKIETLPTLSVGPLNWYWLEEQQQAGLASRDAGQLHSVLLLGSVASSGLKHIKQLEAGTLYFDPTMDRALARQQHSENAWQHILKGGVWVIPILIFAGLALVIAIYKSWQLARLPKVLRFTPAYLHSQLNQPNADVLCAIKGRQKVLLGIALHAANERERDDQLFVQLQQDKHSLERWLLVIGITASVSPLLGLLGTVSGMIETFKMMTLFGSGDPEVVSGGIAQALITTELGLVVAIPALILNAILSKRAKSYYHELENFAISLSQPQDNNTKPQEQVAA